MKRSTRMMVGVISLGAGATFALSAPAMAEPEGGFKSNPAHDCEMSVVVDPNMGNENSANGSSTVYDPNFDGADSMNGNGNNGLHLGRPCAGSVGKADWKDPKGQLPGPDKDGNLNANPNSMYGGNVGYECDENQGIALTNPAHTGCESSS
jgi:hypothetical protein